MHKTVAALLVAFLAPCQTTTTTEPPSTTSSTIPEPVLSVDVVGDSLTAQAYEYVGGWVDAPSSDTERIAEPGWDMADAQGPYNASVAANPPDVTVLALGNNDADPASGGWDIFDIVRWNTFLASTPAGSCIVVVLPRFGPTANLNWAREVNEARGFIVDLVAPGGQFQPPPGRPVVLVDWYLPPVIHPDWLAADGIHISAVDDNAPARARQDQYWDGVGNCP